MTERPLIFTGESVRAILAGTKTQSRRVLPHYDGPGIPEPVPVSRGCFDKPGGWHFVKADGVCDWHVRCPHGEPGDQLWVRESFYVVFNGYDDEDFDGYVADGTKECSRGYRRKRPSIFLHRCDSRITLELLAVRTERLQDISEADAVAEGCAHHESNVMSMATGYGATFCEEWDRLNGKHYPWSSNCWVWVLSFRRIKP